MIAANLSTEKRIWNPRGSDQHPIAFELHRAHGILSGPGGICGDVDRGRPLVPLEAVGSRVRDRGLEGTRRIRFGTRDRASLGFDYPNDTSVGGEDDVTGRACAEVWPALAAATHLGFVRYELPHADQLCTIIRERGPSGEQKGYGPENGPENLGSSFVLRAEFERGQR